jgi:hypothetical protein
MWSRWRIGILAVAIVSVSAFVGVALTQFGTASVSAQEVAERAELAESKLLDDLGPDTTLHVVEVSYAPRRGAESGEERPFRLPERHRSEWWAYFAPDGQLSTLRTEVRDESSGELVQTIDWIDGSLVYTDVPSGEIKSHEFRTFSEETLREQIGAAQIQAVDLVAPDGAAKSHEVEGIDAFVVDRGNNGFVTRSYISKQDYREIKWERLEGDTVVQSRSMPLFEIVAGNQSP